MFDRNRMDNVLPEPGAVPVEVVLVDGTTSRGKLLVPVGKTVAEALNGTGGFVEFEPYGGERGFLAKAQLASVTPVGVPGSVCTVFDTPGSPVPPLVVAVTEKV